MATYPGNPDALIPLNSPGSGGDFIVSDAASTGALLAVQTGGPQILFGADVSFINSGGARHEINASEGINVYSTEDVRIGDNIKPMTVSYRSATNDVLLSAAEFTALAGPEVRLDGGQPNNPQEPTFGVLTRVRRNGADPDKPEDRLIIEDTDASGSDGQVLMRTVATTGGWDLELRALDSAGNRKKITLRGNIELFGTTSALDGLTVTGATTLQTTAVQGSLDVEGPMAIQDASPTLTLDDTGASVEHRIEGGTELTIVRDAGSGAEDLLTLQRQSASSGLGTRFITRLVGPSPVAAPDSEEGTIVFGDRATLQCDDGSAEIVAPHGAMIVNKVDGTGLADSIIVAGDLGGSASARQAISLGATTNTSVMRFGQISVSGGSGGGAITFNDRFRVEASGRVRVWDPASTGSPGIATPIYDLDPSTGDTIQSVGQGSGTAGASRGRVFARRGNSSSPGLVMLEADDGTPVFLSAWRDGPNVRVRASLSVPTGPLSGEPVVDL